MLTEIRPQKRQEAFLSNPADIVIFGGSAGGGKSWSLLIEPLRHISNKNFGAVIFRRTIPEITHEGALWDNACEIYPLLDGTANQNERQFTFRSGARVTFSHMQREDDKLSWKAAQIPLMCFDQFETFSETQFFYMLSRSRSMCGVRPYIRATCNPEPGWLADFLAWWIGEDGYAITERSGCMRWMVRENDVTHWADTPEELTEQHPESMPKSVTFILSTVYDNQILLDKNPEYLANLNALPLVDRERLLGDRERGGNWKIKTSGEMVFDNLIFRQVTDGEISAFDRIYQGLDFGYFPDPLHWGKMHYNVAKLTLYIFDEFRALKMSNRQLYDKLIKDKGVTNRDMIIADSADPKSIADLREFGLNIRGAEKGAGSLDYSMKWLQSLTNIVIDPDRCPVTAREFSSYLFPQDKNGDFVAAYPDADNHSIDASRYAMNGIWRRRGA